MDDETLGVVLDIGSANLRAGFAGDDAPRAMLPSVLGRPRHRQMMVGIGNKDCYVGDEAESQRGHLTLKRPVHNGIVDNWDDWERLVHHAFYNELRIAPEEHPLLLTVPVLNPLANEQKACQIMFETFSVPAMGGVIAPALSLYASGRGSGLVVEIGDGVTQIVPIYESRIIDEAIIRTDVAGEAMTNYMAKLMSERSPRAASLTSSDMFNIDKMKRECCYVAADYEAEMNDYLCTSAKDMEFPFPDGTSHSLGNERIRVGEMMFKPKLAGFETPGLHHLVYKSLMQCPMDTRKDFYTNIILSGGVTRHPGFGERLKQEVLALLPANMRCSVVTPPERWYSTWIGGSIVGSLSTWLPRLMTKEQYDECGPMAFHRYGCLQTHSFHPTASIYQGY
jgi:actin-related protein